MCAGELLAACERRGVLLNRDLEVDDNGIGSLETDEEEEERSFLLELLK